jgi:hypothetical protein
LLIWCGANPGTVFISGYDPAPAASNSAVWRDELYQDALHLWDRISCARYGWGKVKRWVEIHLELELLASELLSDMKNGFTSPF